MSGHTRLDGAGVRQPPAGPPRRLFVVGGVAATLAVLVDHGLRVDLPPPPPPVPTRRPAPDERLLVGVVRDLEDLLATWPRAGSPRELVTLRRLLTAQRTVLEGRLTNAGVPTAEMTAPAARATSPGAATSTTTPRATTSTTPLSRTALARRLGTVDPALWAATSSATTTTRELLTAAYGLRLAGAQLLGSTIAMPKPSPVRAGLVERTSPLVYAFEIVAAQSLKAQRLRALAALGALRSLARELADGLDTSRNTASGATDGGSPMPGGWSLPMPVTDSSSARKLGDHVLQVAVASTADALGPRPTAASVEDVAHWAARIDVVASDWGLGLTAFPGATT